MKPPPIDPAIRAQCRAWYERKLELQRAVKAAELARRQHGTAKMLARQLGLSPHVAERLARGLKAERYERRKRAAQSPHGRRSFPTPRGGSAHA